MCLLVRVSHIVLSSGDRAVSKVDKTRVPIKLAASQRGPTVGQRAEVYVRW